MGKKRTLNANLGYRYFLVDPVYLGERIVEIYLDREQINQKLKYHAMHMITTHMDTMEKHMVVAYIVNYADSIDSSIENLISYPRNAMNPIEN